jgi:ATP-dependent Lon protease
MQGSENQDKTGNVANEGPLGGVDIEATVASGIFPILPTPNQVIFPGASYSLTLRGVQARSLASAALTGNGLAALFMQRPLAERIEPTPADLSPIGTLARLTQVSWADDSTVHVTAEGIRAVRLERVTQWEPFVAAVVSPVTTSAEDSDRVWPLVEQARTLYSRLIALDPRVDEQVRPNLDRATSHEALANLIASTIPISPNAQQAILETRTIEAKLVTLISYLVKALEVGRETRGSGHVSYSQGDDPTRAPHLDAVTLDKVQLEEKLRGIELPGVAEAVVLQELERLSLLAPTSPDYNSTRSYLQWLADLPWGGEEVQDIDLARATSILDRDHFGLAEIKSRIIEHLAVRKLRFQRGLSGTPEGTEQPRQPVLCLVGPPGVGKTSLGRSIAEALARPFVRISLGGVSDEAEIRGHRRTYLGAMPGRLIQALARSGSNQPLLLLDEIDKVNADAKGDPTSALLDVLDPEQQEAFVDHYIGIPFDLSCVFFIATANTLDGVPDALRDRLEVIRLAGYTEEEKLQIAVRHLVPRQMEWHALDSADLLWTDEALRVIVGNYTREAGVRQLDREIATICRRVAAVVASNGSRSPKEPHVADSELVTELLGTPRFLPTEPLDTDQPGVVTGVFWTPVGGDIMHVEASIMPGNKTLTVTGQLGEVMKESAQAALSYVRAHADELQLSPDFYDHLDIHLHIPSGAVSKDGPSAGVALAVSLISVLRGVPVPGDLAMTGELTLRGKVLPVGGIKEKALAARRAGIRRVLIPALNRSDLDSLQSDVLADLDFIEVDSMQDVIKAAFAAY